MELQVASVTSMWDDAASMLHTLVSRDWYPAMLPRWSLVPSYANVTVLADMSMVLRCAGSEISILALKANDMSPKQCYFVSLLHRNYDPEIHTTSTPSTSGPTIPSRSPDTDHPPLHESVHVRALALSLQKRLPSIESRNGARLVTRAWAHWGGIEAGI